MCQFFLKHNGTHLFSFVDQDRYPTWSDYLESMEKEGTWGDNLVLQAAANYYRTSICVISSLGQENELLISPDSPGYASACTTNTSHQQSLVLGHVSELHFVSLISSEGIIIT